MIEVYMLRLDERKAAALYPVMLNYVSESKREAVRRYRRPIDAYRSLTGEILARLAISKRWQLSNDELSFYKNEFGKPLLHNPSIGCHFNVSHSGDWVVCAFGDCPVGIDIERMKPQDLSIAERFFTSDEYKMLMSLAGSRQLTYFYQLWTLKESYIKAVGKGMSIPLDSFSFLIKEDGEVAASLEEGASAAYFMQTFADDDHAMALCAFHQMVPIFKELDYEELESLLSTLH
ncbi:4'-phosphopantetheinyl transferase [Paenibacillus algorifonticola]|uniref:4'-phosphopantetheinyl transferase n=1 Tax=Paenibacillus algorifonticola TaxID=684063 RepID=A0A1I1YU98_9BACL|nr:4'-phosphopantetheinyl transferase superfamily protein [Paenibacillus algorifonticola]SFE23021.1 4'-phosphopantetheinyl transferase [Paenibacillus algorifonticola]